MARQSSDFFNTHRYFQRKVIFDFRHIKIKKFMEIGRGDTINNFQKFLLVIKYF